MREIDTLTQHYIGAWRSGNNELPLDERYQVCTGRASPKRLSRPLLEALGVPLVS
jgi:hypothetical protein